MGTGGIIAISGAAVLVAGAAVCFIKNRQTIISKIKRKFSDGYTVETIEGELKMFDIVSYFKKQNLVKERDIPFVGDAQKLKEMFKEIPSGEGKNNIFVGVYNTETDEIMYAKLICAFSIDSKLKEVLGNEPLVVLN